MPTGTGEILPSALARLLDPNPEVRESAVGESLGAVTHQNTIYEATVPVALFVAAILNHPATTAGEAGRAAGRVSGYPTRVALLDWLGSAANDACVASGGRTPHSVIFDEGPALRAFCELRPVFYRAVHPLLGDDHEEVRHAALVAAVPLVRHPLLTGHRGELADHARSLLASSTHRHRRDHVLEALAEWGHDVSGLENADDVAVREHWTRQRAERWTGGCADDPPF